MQRPRLLLLDEPSLGLAPSVVAEIFRIVRELNEKEGLSVLVVEQNATIALDAAARAYVLEVGRVVVDGHERRAAARRVRPAELSGVLMAQLPATGRQRARDRRDLRSLALAIVLIYRATRVINFAQGEMAMFATFIACG